MDNVKVASQEKIHISSGAVVIRPTESGREVLLLYQKNTDSWHLPKGTKRPNESVLETALREVKEETGVEIVVEKYLGSLQSVKEDGYTKLTYYYLAGPSNIAVSDHDAEYDNVRFVGFNEAYRLLRQKPIFEKEYELFDKYLR